MANPFESLLQLIQSKFQNSTPVLTNNQQAEGPLRPDYTVFPHLLGRSATTADRAYGSGQTGANDYRSNGFLPQGYVSEGDYQPDTHNYSPPDNLNHISPVPRSIGVGTDGRNLYTGSVPPPHENTQADYTLTQGRSASMWEVLEFPAGWRSLLVPQQAARYNLYTQIDLAKPTLGPDYFIGYSIPYGSANQYPSSGMGRPLGS